MHISFEWFKEIDDELKEIINNKQKSSLNHTNLSKPDSTNDSDSGQSSYEKIEKQLNILSLEIQI